MSQTRFRIYLAPSESYPDGEIVRIVAATPAAAEREMRAIERHAEAQIRKIKRDRQ
ncbi:hypothetical protein [Pelagibacterium montanilacus]|uniref:hypothetical protein n=1 Tax=Pelagibacterium montanilacus TaxID=2185280 RepID=UPI0013DF1B59|nr:hypothetical protein [Pelagibacterium montanilacus]